MRKHVVTTLVAAVVVALTTGGCKPRNSGSDVASASGSGSDYTGHADYRLVFVNHAGPDFDPNQDLLKPSVKEKEREAVANALQGAALKSMIPMFGELTGQKKQSQTDLLTALMSAADSARKSLRKELQSRTGSDPVVAEAWLVPWPEEPSELFYDAYKISISPTELVNVIKAVPGSTTFAKQFKERVEALRTRLRKDSKDPVFLLGARYFLFSAPGKSQLTMRVLVGLQPFSGPFVKDDPKVKFEKVVVPDIQDKGITAAITFTVSLEGNDAPIVSASFGDFKGIEKGNFVMETSTAARYAPRLEGQANKPGTGWIKLNFAFRDMSLNLRTAQLTQISTLVSPGIKLGGARWTVGGIHAESIDQTFQTEINNTIDGEIQGAINSANDEILDGMMSKDTMEMLFKKIFHRT